MLAVLTAGFTTACDSSESDPPAELPDLVVTYADWNGWEPDHVPAPESRTLASEEGERLELEIYSGVSLEVVDIDGDEVTIEVSEQMSPRASGGGMDLNDLTDTFVVTPDAPASFSTPTLDGGWNFDVAFDGTEESYGADGTSPE